MITRNEILSEAVDRCMKDLYSEAYPKVSWEEFVQQNKEHSDKYFKGNKLKEGFTCKDIPPKPYEFYYVPKKIFDSIVKDYLYAYRIPPEIQDNIATLIDYFKKPIRDKWIPDKVDEDGLNHPGYRGYEEFSPLDKIIGEENFEKVKEYMQEAKNFYKWDRDEQSFNYSVYLGASPSSNRERVIENWKLWRNTDITIPIDKEIVDTYYGEED